MKAEFVPAPVPKPPDLVQLTLTQEEASILLALLYTGCSHCGPIGNVLRNIQDGLMKLGIKSGDYMAATNDTEVRVGSDGQMEIDVLGCKWIFMTKGYRRAFIQSGGMKWKHKEQHYDISKKESSKS